MDVAIFHRQDEFIPTRGFQTKSGLKYFDIKVSNTGPTPRYGTINIFFFMDSFEMYF